MSDDKNEIDAVQQEDAPALSPKQTAFLAAYAVCGNVTGAAQAARCDRTSHYVWLRPERDPAGSYAAAFARAGEEFVERLEHETVRRALQGVDEPVIFKGQLMGHWETSDGGRALPDGAKVTERTPGARFVPLTVKRYSDQLMMFLLKGKNPDVYREKPARIDQSQHQHTHVNVVDMTDDQLRREIDRERAAVGRIIDGDGRGPGRLEGSPGATGGPDDGGGPA